jgi:hypothetical protein
MESENDDGYVRVNCVQCGKFLGYWDSGEEDINALCYACEYGLDEDEEC